MKHYPAWLILFAVVACTAETTPQPVTRAEAEAMGGKSDTGLDLCAIMSWYGDGAYCDCFCPDPDPDCDDATLPVFGICQEPDCVDDSDCRELVCPGGAGFCHEQCIEGMCVLPEPEPDCVDDSDCRELVCPSGAGFCHEQCIEGMCVLPEPEPDCVDDSDCRELVCPGGTGLCHELCVEGMCILPEPPTSFVRFRWVETRNLCVVGDCVKWVELRADGTLTGDLDLFNDGSTVSATLSVAERDAAIAILGAPELGELLESGGGCPGPTEFLEQMYLETFEGTVERVTSFCTDAPLQSARDEVTRLVDGFLD